MRYRIILLLLLLFIGNSCRSKRVVKERQLQCFNNYIIELQKTEDYKIVRKSFLDSLHHWIDMGIKQVQAYEMGDWILDSAIFFNADRTKALLLIPLIYRDSLSYFDDVKIVAGEKLKGRWQFYYESYPDELYSRKEWNNRKPLTLQTLSDNTRYDILSDGYFKGRSCKIVYEYIDSKIWFTDDRRGLHKEFLTDTIPKLLSLIREHVLSSMAPIVPLSVD